MNALTIAITSSCNFACDYCPTKRWLVPIDSCRTDVNMITNEALLKWLDAYIEPAKWIIEITGGEPGLYPEINLLVEALNKRGYWGLIKTNGSMLIVKSKQFKLIAAWHKGREFPAHYDEIVIIKNPDDNWKDKAAYCEENKIKYHAVLYDRQYEGKKIEPEYCRHNKIISSCHVNSSGQITPCSRIKPAPENTIFNMTPPRPLEVIHECPRCKNINDVVLFLDAPVKAKIDADLEEFKRHPFTN